jgi:hypothetical protein
MCQRRGGFLSFSLPFEKVTEEGNVRRKRHFLIISFYEKEQEEI